MRQTLLATLVLAAIAAEPAMALEEKTLSGTSQAAATDPSADSGSAATAPPPSGFTIGATGLSPYYSASGVSFDQLMQSDTERALSYFTPRWGGLQLGLTYYPDTADGSSDATTLTDGSVDVGMSYDSEVGPLGLTLFAGTSGGGADKDPDTDPADQRQWGVGGELRLGAFSVGGEVSREGLAYDLPIGEHTDWTVGLGYRTAIWGVSLGLARRPGEPQNQVELSAVYDLAPGAVLTGGARWWRQDGTDAETDDIDNVLALIFGTKLSF